MWVTVKTKNKTKRNLINGKTAGVKTEKKEGNFRYGCFVHVSVTRQAREEEEGEADGMGKEGRMVGEFFFCEIFYRTDRGARPAAEKLFASVPQSPAVLQQGNMGQYSQSSVKKLLKLAAPLTWGLARRRSSTVPCPR